MTRVDEIQEELFVLVHEKLQYHSVKAALRQVAERLARAEAERDDYKRLRGLAQESAAEHKRERERLEAALEQAWEMGFAEGDKPIMRRSPQANKAHDLAFIRGGDPAPTSPTDRERLGGSVVVPPPSPDQIQYVADLIKWREESTKRFTLLERVVQHAYFSHGLGSRCHTEPCPLAELAREVAGRDGKA